MFKIVIVDDEPNIRKGLKLIIDWDNLECEICGEATNGMEALEIIKENKPDIVITDIKMPQMNGLDMIREVRSLGLKTQFIILSGHNEFSFAQEALKNGARQYLLKPIDEDELAKTIKEISEEIKRNSNNSESVDRLIVRDLFRQLLSPDREGIDSALKDQLKITNEISFYTALLEVHSPHVVKTDRVEDLINSCMPEGIRTAVIYESYNLYCFIIHSGMLKPYRNRLNLFAMEIISTAEKNINIEASLYVGSRERQLKNMPLSRKHAYEAMEHKYYRDNGAIIEYNNIINLSFNSRYQELLETGLLIQAIQNNREAEMEQLCFQLEDKFREQYLSAELIYLHLNNLLNQMLCQVSEQGGDMNALLTDAEFITCKEKNITISLLGEKLLKLSLRCRDIICNTKIRRQRGTAVELEEYLLINYTENLSLKSVSEIFNINTAYLGQLFKKHTGISFNTYLHNIRLKKAKELLVSTDFKIYEIAKQIGYHDVNYFMKKFEASYHITANTYRKQNR